MNSLYLEGLVSLLRYLHKCQGIQAEVRLAGMQTRVVQTYLVVELSLVQQTRLLVSLRLQPLRNKVNLVFQAMGKDYLVL